MNNSTNEKKIKKGESQGQLIEATEVENQNAENVQCDAVRLTCDPKRD